MSRYNTDELSLKAYGENKNEFAVLLASFRYAIDNDQIPKTEDLLKKKSPNSNLFYINLLNKFGFIEIIRKFGEKHKINKQNLVPISKKLGKILWNDLSDEHRKFFDKLALEV